MDPQHSGLRLVVRAATLLIVFPLTEKVKVLKERSEQLVYLEAQALLSQVVLSRLLVKQLAFALIIIALASCLADHASAFTSLVIHDSLVVKLVFSSRLGLIGALAWPIFNCGHFEVVFPLLLACFGMLLLDDSLELV